MNVKFFKTYLGAENFMALCRAFRPQNTYSLRVRDGLDFRQHYFVITYIERGDDILEVPLGDLTPANRKIARQRLAARKD
jgi:hypothetical protein